MLDRRKEERSWRRMSEPKNIKILTNTIFRLSATRNAFLAPSSLWPSPSCSSAMPSALHRSSCSTTMSTTGLVPQTRLLPSCLSSSVSCQTLPSLVWYCSALWASARLLKAGLLPSARTLTERPALRACRGTLVMTGLRRLMFKRLQKMVCTIVRRCKSTTLMTITTLKFSEFLCSYIYLTHFLSAHACTCSTTLAV